MSEDLPSIDEVFDDGRLIDEALLQRAVAWVPPKAIEVDEPLPR